MSDMVKVTKNGAIWEIVFDRPKANAISVAASKALSDTFCAFRDDPTASVAIITGGGEKFFSAGWDLKAAAAGEESTDSSSGAAEGGFAGLTELWSLDKPVIAAVNGVAAGARANLALGREMVVAVRGGAKSMFVARGGAFQWINTITSGYACMGHARRPAASWAGRSCNTAMCRLCEVQRV